MTMAPILFFDGGCPLCRREIAHYRRLDREGRIHWVDIHSDPAALAPYGIAPEEAMRRIHAINEDGRPISGVAAFVLVWRHLPGYRWLVRGLSGLRLVGPLDRAYGRFAAWRYRRRCDRSVCGTARDGD